MTRKLYETDEDRSTEARVIARFRDAYSFSAARKMPIACYLDYAMLENGIVTAVAEIKCRSRFYDTMIVPVMKYLRAVDYIRFGLDAYLIVAVGADIRITRFERDLDFGLSLKWGGRIDRNDPGDLYPVVHIPLNRFRPLIQENRP